MRRHTYVSNAITPFWLSWIRLEPIDQQMASASEQEREEVNSWKLSYERKPKLLIGQAQELFEKRIINSQKYGITAVSTQVYLTKRGVGGHTSIKYFTDYHIRMFWSVSLKRYVYFGYFLIKCKIKSIQLHRDKMFERFIYSLEMISEANQHHLSMLSFYQPLHNPLRFWSRPKLYHLTFCRSVSRWTEIW